MGNGWMQRFRNVALEGDEAVNAAGGGLPGESISGTIGRACGYGQYGKKRWWGPIAASALEHTPFFAKGHCYRTALDEARNRAALEQARATQPDATGASPA